MGGASLHAAIIVAITLLSLTHPATSLPSQELDGALSVLHFRGRALFANAIASSDLLFDILSADSLTLLAPPDPSLFALDMTKTISFYISTLRIHALPLRLSLSDLRSLPNASSVSTLLPSRRLFLTRPHSGPTDSFDLDRVRILLPGLFYSRHLAVHGLAGVLPLTRTRTRSPPDTNTTITFSPTAGAAVPLHSLERAVSPALESSRMILPPSPSSNPTIFSPAAGPTWFGDFAPGRSTQVSPHQAPALAARTYVKPPKVGEVTLVKMVSLPGKNGVLEDKNQGMESEPLVMETSEF